MFSMFVDICGVRYICRLLIKFVVMFSMFIYAWIEFVVWSVWLGKAGDSLVVFFMFCRLLWRVFCGLSVFDNLCFLFIQFTLWQHELYHISFSIYYLFIDSLIIQLVADLPFIVFSVFYVWIIYIWYILVFSFIYIFYF